MQAARRQRRRPAAPPRAGLSLDALKDVGGLLVFSALPFVAVQALADSQLGKDLMARLDAEKPALRRAAAQRERERAAARTASPWFGAGRPGWLGPWTPAPPPHLA